MTASYNRDLLARLDREQDRINDENDWARPDERERATASRLQRELLGTVPADAVLALLPANADPLAPRDPARLESFAQRLKELAATAESPETPTSPPHDAFIAAVCTGCRGSCCRSGGDHAYLTEQTLARVRQDHPDWTPDQLQQEYLSRVPAESILDSCLYHSATGCGLPRDLRSDTCNRHLCGKLLHLRATGPQAPVLAVFFDQGRWARTGLIDDAGCRILSDSAEE